MIYDFKPTREDYLKIGIEPILPLKPGYVVEGTNDKVFKNLANDVNTRRYFVKLISLTTGLDYDYLLSNMKLYSNNTQEGSVYEHFNEQDVIVTQNPARADFIGIIKAILFHDFNVSKNVYYCLNNLEKIKLDINIIKLINWLKDIKF